MVVSATKFAAGYDLATGELIWKAKGLGRNAIPQPVPADGTVYVMTGFQQPNLMAIRLGREAKAGKPSPVAANGKLYLATEDGDVVVVKMGEKFEVLATNTLAGQMFISSPLIVGGEIYLRGQNALFCIR